ncbi:M23 family metallopeptidase [Hwanghaeella sp.]|uniref:M23 family metallopeptidase n=1 Tax=Hwanghaeella sp. TaxID=2605943 RepID=UPI003CCC2AB0
MQIALKALTACLLAIVLSGPLHAQTPPPLDFPADCRIGADCWILSFVDLDSGPGYRDHRCGPRTYEGHKGTDIALIDAFDTDQTVAVRAAAAGTVVGVRDGMPDNDLGKDIAGEKGRECGNGVRISHGGEWFTQYCHLKQGSIQVKPQQRVSSGALLGLIGNSGRSETPHLHFRLSRDTLVVDPFTGHSASETPRCEGGTPMWSDTALTAFGDYAPTLIRHAGFSVTTPTLRGIQKTPPPTNLPGNRSALYIYTIVYGVPEGSTIRFSVSGPDGGNLINTSQTIPRTRARQFQYAGKKAPSGGWPAGFYTGEVRVDLPPPFADASTTRTVTVRVK